MCVCGVNTLIIRELMIIDCQVWIWGSVTSAVMSQAPPLINCVVGCFIYLLIGWFVCFNTNINMRVIWSVNNQWSESVCPETRESADSNNQTLLIQHRAIQRWNRWRSEIRLLMLSSILIDYNQIYPFRSGGIDSHERISQTDSDGTNRWKEGTEVMSSSCFNRKCITWKNTSC